jgi:putative membrane protein
MLAANINQDDCRLTLSTGAEAPPLPSWAGTGAATARCGGIEEDAMTRKTLILLSASALAIAGCGQRDDSANDAANIDANIAADANLAIDNSIVAAAPMSAQGFANTMAASDRFEVESSRLAAATSQSAAIKSFANQMITAHTESTAKLKAAAAGLTPPVTPDDTLTADQQRMLDELKSKSAADFDSAYAAAQVSGHQAALDALNAYAAGGDTPALAELAKGMVPTVTEHLSMAKGLK